MGHCSRLTNFAQSLNYADKIKSLLGILRNRGEPIVVFCNSDETASEVAARLNMAGRPCSLIKGMTFFIDQDSNSKENHGNLQEV